MPISEDYEKHAKHGVKHLTPEQRRYHSTSEVADSTRKSTKKEVVEALITDLADEQLQEENRKLREQAATLAQIVLDEEQGQGEPSGDPDEVTPIDRCVRNRMDLYGESEEEAHSECEKMLTTGTELDQLKMKRMFTVGDPEEIGVAMSDWEWNHAPEYQWWRDKKAAEERGFQKAVDRKEKEMRWHNVGGMPPNASPEDWRRVAEREVRRERAITKQDQRNARLTVGDLRGKSREQLVKEARGESDDE